MPSFGNDRDLEVYFRRLVPYWLSTVRCQSTGLRPVTGANPFPHFPTVDGEVRTGLKAQPDLAAANLEHRDLEQALKAMGLTDDH
jgi:hypothetical protein